MTGHEIFAIGTSAGGVNALQQIASGLPKNFPAAVLAVLHMGPGSPGVLPAILGRSGPLPALVPEDGQPVEPGHIYLPLPDHHLLVESGRLRLSRGPKQNRARPAIDPLFRSVARHYGSRAVGVVLTGNLDDGTAGLEEIKRRGGVAVVQDPADALFPSMPKSALRHVSVDHQPTLAELPALLVRLAETRPGASVPVSERLEQEIRSDAGEALGDDSTEQMARFAQPTSFVCPDCNGGLWEVDDPRLMRFRCRTGHAYGAETLVATHGEKLENTLWAAVRALEENASLARRVAERMGATGSTRQRLEERAREAMEHSVKVRDILKAGASADTVE